MLDALSGQLAPPCLDVAPVVLVVPGHVEDVLCTGPAPGDVADSAGVHRGEITGEDDEFGAGRERGDGVPVELDVKVGEDLDEHFEVPRTLSALLRVSRQALLGSRLRRGDVLPPTPALRVASPGRGRGYRPGALRRRRGARPPGSFVGRARPALAKPTMQASGPSATRVMLCPRVSRRIPRQFSMWLVRDRPRSVRSGISPA